MFYHVRIYINGDIDWFHTNNARDEVISNFICPFIEKEITLKYGAIFNMSSVWSIVIYRTDHLIDSEWPIKKSDYTKEKFADSEIVADHYYDKDLESKLKEIATDVTGELYKEAIILIKSGEYEELRNRIEKEKREKYSFFICPFDDEEIDHNYEYVIKPMVEKHQYKIQRADEISHTNLITTEILNAISRSDFIVADLTHEKPNCYYEIGFAHSLGRPVIILAKEGTNRHFDISGYRWNYWKDYKDLKTKLEKELDELLKRISSKDQRKPLVRD